jgi:hypothetical protein
MPLGLCPSFLISSKAYSWGGFACPDDATWPLSRLLGPSHETSGPDDAAWPLSELLGFHNERFRRCHLASVRVAIAE